MTYYPKILIDTGVMVAFYDAADDHHTDVVEFFQSCTSRLVTTLRLELEAIATLDQDFDIYRRYRNQPFIRVFYPSN